MFQRKQQWQPWKGYRALAMCPRFFFFLLLLLLSYYLSMTSYLSEENSCRILEGNIIVDEKTSFTIFLCHWTKYVVVCYGYNEESIFHGSLRQCLSMIYNPIIANFHASVWNIIIDICSFPIAKLGASKREIIQSL